MGVISDRMVGRRRELEALAAWLDDARNGTGRLVLCAGEPGIGKTRLAQELAGLALASGTAVAWGRCVETEGAPAYWPWRQVLRSIGEDPDEVFADNAQADRFRLFDAVATKLAGHLVVILDDVHWADEPSLLLLRHLADQLQSTKLLVFAAYREGQLKSLPGLLGAPSTGRLDLRGFDRDEVSSQLDDPDQVDQVLEVTGGNPLFVREIARAMADGTWRPDRPPRTVLDIVEARLEQISPACRELVQAAAIAGRDFEPAVVAETIGKDTHECLPLVDEAIDAGLITHDNRFVHALTRAAVEASLRTTERAHLHRRTAEVLTRRHPGRVADIARHWAALVPYGESENARKWTEKAAGEAVRSLAYEEGVRLYTAALSYGPDDAKLRRALGRAAYFAGDLEACVKAAQAAAELARTPEELAEAALVLEAAPGAGVNAAAKPLCEEALAKLDGHDALKARLLAQRSHLAFYDGEQDRVDTLSRDALSLARKANDNKALEEALRARQEACPGPFGIVERMAIAEEMIELGVRTSSPRTTMWGVLWRVYALIESGEITRAAEELPALELAADRVGGPYSAWHLEVVSACVAQAQGRYEQAKALGRKAFERMRVFEPMPAHGAYFALQSGLARHLGADEEAVAFARSRFESPPRFRTMARMTRAYLLLRGGFPEEALESYRLAGPMDTWDLPAFFTLPGRVIALLVTARLGLFDDVERLMALLEPHRGAHAVGNGVAYMGPVELALGIGAIALGDAERARRELRTAFDMVERAGAPGFVAEVRRLLDDLTDPLLSPRESEVARLVAEGLTNRGIAERLYISERTAQNHVQHILTKLGFSTRSQIAAWMSTAMSTPADVRPLRNS
ncbi:LuxR family transcriptional regulator [Lentzea sp. NBRC 105346]|uniref:AAA family ATPase n=1 Tax=Lentzea sp. NBRC 105346 TaxID=3032205 RepID=UPI0024A2C60C|nr:AAA family ATPase [Lentzea sp. NBRC 105346]GLZ28393.1 LuxR family transcriptional regulator [Lentzea sp. NBRC 105346]